MSNLKKDVADVEDALDTATGTASIALGGNRAALKVWAGDIAEYLRAQTTSALELPVVHCIPRSFIPKDWQNSLVGLVDVFERIRDGEEPNRAFGWNTGKRGRPSKASSATRRAIMDVSKVEMIEAYIAGGATVREACEQVADERNDSAQRLYQLYRRVH